MRNRIEHFIFVSLITLEILGTFVSAVWLRLFLMDKGYWPKQKLIEQLRKLSWVTNKKDKKEEKNQNKAECAELGRSSSLEPEVMKGLWILDQMGSDKEKLHGLSKDGVDDPTITPKKND